jgi:hypothetical protein
MSAIGWRKRQILNMQTTNTNTYDNYEKRIKSELFVVIQRLQELNEKIQKLDKDRSDIRESISHFEDRQKTLHIKLNTVNELRKDSWWNNIPPYTHYPSLTTTPLPQLTTTSIKVLTSQGIKPLTTTDVKSLTTSNLEKALEELQRIYLYNKTPSEPLWPQDLGDFQTYSSGTTTSTYPWISSSHK